MGLDMYLIRKKYVGANLEHRKVKGKIELEIEGKKLPIEFDRLSYIDEEVGYWRKANAIHKWFVDNVQDGNDDCKEYSVSMEDLEKLLELCKLVKKTAVVKMGKIQNGYRYENGKEIPIMEDGEYIENVDEIATILPTQDGFFFGNVGYNEYYLADINKTIEIIEKLIKDEKEMNELGFYSEFVYSSSW